MTICARQIAAERAANSATEIPQARFKELWRAERAFASAARRES